MENNLHIYAPRSFNARGLIRCKTCRRVRRAAILYYEWHPPICYCCGCGEMPFDSPHKFRRITIARHRKIARAKTLYANATTKSQAIKNLSDYIQQQLKIKT